MATRRTFNSKDSSLTTETAKKRNQLLETIDNQNPEMGKAVSNILGSNVRATEGSAQFNPARIQPMNRTIDGSRLGTESPLTMPNSVPQTSASGLETFISSGLESYKNERATEIQSLQEEKKNSKGAVASIYEKLMGQGQRSEDIYAQEGVDKARKEVDDLTSQIEAEQLANRRQIEELERNNSKGLFGGALQDEVTRLNRDSLQKQADLAIIQNAATRRYDTASAIADRKIQMEFEPLKVQLDAVKFFYAENKDDLSKKEQEQYQEYITAEDRAYTEKYDAAKTLQDTKLELMKSAASQNAPLSVQRAIQAAQTPEEASMAAGQYAGDILDRQYKQMQIANIQSEISARAAEGEGTLNGKPQSATQAQANGYADRLARSNIIISDIGGNFTGSLAFGAKLPNQLQSGDRQAYEQAKRDFVTAVLRRESGAAISDTEFAREELKYFPQAGDKPETVAQKEAARNTAINNLYREANVTRTALPGEVIEADGKRYRVGSDGETLEEI